MAPEYGLPECPVLWCERDHSRSRRGRQSHYVVIQRSQIEGTNLSCTLTWQESSSPLLTIEASSDESSGRLLALNLGVATGLADLIARDIDIYGVGGRFLSEAISLGADILAA